MDKKHFFGGHSSAGHEVNEDFYLLDPQNTLYAVFDGHGGTSAAHNAHANLPIIVSRYRESRKDFRGILCDALSRLDSDFLSLADRDDSGTCAVAVAVEKRCLHIAWMGDCRAIVYDGEKVSYHSEDHTASAQKEVERLTLQHIPIRHGRAFGILEPSRTIGDADVKKLHSQGVIAVSDSVTIDIPRIVPGRAPFVLLVSDGITTSLTNTQTCNIVKTAIRGRKSSNQLAAAAAKTVVEKAREKGSLDDATCICILFA